MAAKGWLIYDEAGIKRNRWFAEHLTECAPTYGLELELQVLPTDGAEWRETGAEFRDRILHDMANECEPTAVPDFAIVRVIAPELSRLLEEKGIRLFNNAQTAYVANNKWTTYESALQWGIPVLETRKADKGETDRSQGNPLFYGGAEWEQVYPVVIKAVAGHGGSQVYLAKDESAQKRILQELFAQGLTTEEIILQKPCSQPGRDMRVYVLGGRIYQAVLRSSTQDFRSNFSLGGEIALAQTSEEQRRVIARLYEKLHFDFVGVDFIAHEGKWILNEIEDVVGTRMLYQLTDGDVVQDYLAYISQQVKSTPKGADAITIMPLHI